MIYAIAKKVARPARISVKNLEFGRSLGWPLPASLNQRPMTVLATASLILVVKPILLVVDGWLDRLTKLFRRFETQEMEGEEDEI